MRRPTLAMVDIPVEFNHQSQRWIGSQISATWNSSEFSPGCRLEDCVDLRLAGQREAFRLMDVAQIRVEFRQIEHDAKAL